MWTVVMPTMLLEPALDEILATAMPGNRPDGGAETESGGHSTESEDDEEEDERNPT
jgi:hypothetical protein